MSERIEILTRMGVDSPAIRSDIRKRPRRLRRTRNLRRMMCETRLRPSRLIQPLFVTHGQRVRNPVSSMPGVHQFSVDQLAAEAEAIAKLRIPAVLLFGLPESKDSTGSESFHPDGVVQQAVAVIKRAVPELVVITDVCLCEYTSHGHCGLLGQAPGPRGQSPEVLNDETLDILDKIAVSHAEAGADMVAPSGMLDGMVRSIRSALDRHGCNRVAILSYAVKYASSFYGPFRDAAEGAPAFGDRKSHQMDPANSREALREAALDVEEGADLLMVKPALPYLDVVYRLRRQFPQVPLVAYHVSGEYSMIKAAAERNWIDERLAVQEVLTSIRRAGADLIITYHSRDVARWLG